MKIKMIGYGRTIPDGDYGNDKYYVEAELEDWEDPAASLEALREWVSKRHNLTSEVDNLVDKKSELKGAIRDIEYKIVKLAGLWNQAENRWNEAAKFLEKHGVPITETFPMRPKFERWIENGDVTTAIEESDVDDLLY